MCVSVCVCVCQAHPLERCRALAAALQPPGRVCCLGPEGTRAVACARRIDLIIYECIHVINHIRTHPHTLIHTSTHLHIYTYTSSYAASMSLQSRLLVAALALAARNRSV